jgi:ParB-like nuclease domain
MTAPRGPKPTRRRSEADPDVREGRVRRLPVDSLRPCPVQPRVNISVPLVRELAASMRSGRHEPVLEVEVLPEESECYQIVCGEQRWRAAKEAGRRQVLALVRPPLSYLERLLKQAEENRFRAALDPVEEAHLILLAKTLHDIRVAERLLDEHGVEHPRLDHRHVGDRAEFTRHLEDLQAQLLAHRIHVLQGAEGELRCRPLSAWRETESALGISEAGRKQKVGILRLPAELLDQVRELPAEHAQISRLPDARRQAELVARAGGLNHDEVRSAVVRLRADPELAVEAALATPGPEPVATPQHLSLDGQLAELADLCRQLVRRLRRLASELEPEQRAPVGSLVAGLRDSLALFEE